MNCDGVRGLLSAYLDGELTSGELLRVEQHLRRCHGCAGEVESLRKTISLVAGLDEVPLPADFHVKLHQRLVALGPPVDMRPVVPAWQRGLRTWVLPAAAAAAALAVGLSTLQSAPSAEGILGPARVVDMSPKSPAPAPTSNPGQAPTSSQTTPPAVTTTAPPLTTVTAPPTTTARPDTAATPPATSGQPTAVKPNTTGTTAVTTPAPLGATAAGLSAAYAVSYLEGLPAKSSLPAYATAYQFVYQGDPVRVGATLSAQFPGKVVVTDSQATIKLPATEAAEALKAIRQVLGTAGLETTTQRHDYGSALDQAYSRVQYYDSLRNNLYQAKTSVTDKGDLEAAARELDRYQGLVEQEKSEIARIRGFVSEATVVITFAKQAQ